MVSKPKTSKRPPVKDRGGQILPQAWRFLLVVVLVIGIVFRFANLERKVFWLDEVKATYKISGYENIEYQQRFNGQIISPEDFQKYGEPKPESTISDTVKILTKEDSKHVPLYFIILRLWVDCFGNSIAAIRSLSAVIGLWSQDNGLSLSYFLDSKVRLQLLAEQKLLEIPQDFQDIFLFAPSENLLNKIKQKREFKLEQISPMIFSANNLFKVYLPLTRRVN